jgi:DNA-binding protein HU-beta
MTKVELIRKLSEESGETQASAERFLDALGTVVTAALVAGDEVAIIGVGKLSTTVRAERKGRNPQTGESITIAAHKVAVFKPSSILKDAIK